MNENHEAAAAMPDASIAAELLDQTKPWYTSTTILALIAGLIIAGLNMLGLLPAELTKEKLTEFLLVAAPIAVAIFGRLKASTSLVKSKLPEIDPYMAQFEELPIRGRATGNGTGAIVGTVAIIGAIAMLLIVIGLLTR